MMSTEVNCIKSIDDDQAIMRRSGGYLGPFKFTSQSVSHDESTITLVERVPRLLFSRPKLKKPLRLSNVVINSMTLFHSRRTRSLNAPSPFQQFGPCGRIMKNSAMVMQIQDPASQRLTWYKPPLAVLVIKKVRDSTVLSPFIQLVEWLIEEKHMVVWVESAVLDDPLLMEDKKFIAVKDKLVTFK